MDKEQKSKTMLTASEIRKYKAMLLAKQSEILENVESMEQEALMRERSDLSNAPIHFADAGTDSYEIDNTLGLMDSERKLLKQIDEALQRIEDGTYGICAGHGEMICAKRLEAIPWARYCVDCANLAERDLMQEQKISGHSDYDYGPNDEDEQDREGFYERVDKA
jgi:RNA polymerase-binding protein DksA